MIRRPVASADVLAGPRARPADRRARSSGSAARSSTRCSTASPARPTTGCSGCSSARAVPPRQGDPAIALRMGAALGVESLLTNGPIKACFRRVRPDDDHPPEGPLPYGMHRPITSSFPSGHAASAFTAATLLAGGPATPAVVRAGGGGRGQPGVHADAPHLRHRRRRRARRRAGRDRAPDRPPRLTPARLPTARVGYGR